VLKQRLTVSELKYIGQVALREECERSSRYLATLVSKALEQLAAASEEQVLV
jgi:hypothetical protein